MVNYACAFSQSELGKYFEWIIKLFNKLSKIYKYINTSNNSSQNSLIYFMLVILASSSYSIPIIPRGSFQVACEKKKLGIIWGRGSFRVVFRSILGIIWGRGSFRVVYKSDSSIDGEPQGNWKWNSNSRDIAAITALLPFPTLAPELPGELARKLPWTWGSDA